MNTYLVLLRGINVGGNSTVSMATLKGCLEKLGFENVVTYINSGNVILDSKLSAKKVTEEIEAMLPTKFKLDKLVRVLVLTEDELQKVVSGAPKGFGAQPEKYHSDAIFLLEGTASEFITLVDTNPEVDKAWAGKGVMYFQRLSAERTKSRMSKIIAKPFYKSLTIRNWNTTTKLLALMKARKST